MTDFFNYMKNVFLPVFAAVLLLSGCSGYKDIRVDSCRLESISPVGFKAVEAGFSMQVHNPAKELVFSDIEGTVYLDGSELGNFEAPDVTVPGRTVSDVHVDLTATLSQSFSLMQLMSLASGAGPGKFTMDISMRVKIRGGIGRKVCLEDVPVESLFRKISYENI